MFSSHATPAIPIFQSYLLPSLPFQRRRSSVDTQAFPPVAGFSPVRHASISTAATSPPASLPGSPASDQHVWEPDYSFSPTDRGQYLTGHTSTMACARCHAHLALTSQIISKGFTGRHGRAYLVSPAVTPFSPSEAHHRRSSLSFFKTSVIGRFNSSSSVSSLASRSPPTYSNPFASSTTTGQPDGSALDLRASSPTRERAQSNAAPQNPPTQRRHSTTIPDPKTLPNTHTHRAAPRRLVTGMHTVADITCMVCGSQLGWKYVAAEEDTQRYKVGKFILEAKRVIIGVDWESPSTAGHGIKEDGDSFNELDEMFGATSLENTLESDIAADDHEILFDSQDEDECEDLFAGVWSPALARRRRRSRPNNA